jgi:hypothetical protein
MPIPGLITHRRGHRSNLSSSSRSSSGQRPSRSPRLGSPWRGIVDRSRGLPSARSWARSRSVCSSPRRRVGAGSVWPTWSAGASGAHAAAVTCVPARRSHRRSTASRRYAARHRPSQKRPVLADQAGVGLPRPMSSRPHRSRSPRSRLSLDRHGTATEPATWARPKPRSRRRRPRQQLGAGRRPRRTPSRPRRQGRPPALARHRRRMDCPRPRRPLDRPRLGSWHLACSRVGCLGW